MKKYIKREKEMSILILILEVEMETVRCREIRQVARLFLHYLPLLTNKNK